MGVVRAMRQLVSGESPAALTEEIAALRAEGRGALDEAAAKAAAAITAETLEQAERLQQEAARSRLRAARAEARLPELLERLTAAKAREQAAALERRRTRWVALYGKLRKAIEAAAAVQAEVIRADLDACAELGEAVVRRHLPALSFRGLLLPDLVQLWTDEMDGIISAPAARPAPIAQPAAPAEHADGGGLQHAVMLEREKPVPKAAKAPDDVAPLEPGQCGVKVLRAGFEAPDGSQCHRGRAIRLPRKIAEAAEANGAITIIESAPLLTV